ncbi:cytochrome P450 [Bimuria novae-zelandiae CBS 107.79]|uniref:Cytochrome P450 n=1 Tax=Bimuria novae-zelandiae CBS 107.79 TaxID=1447943 RepID=A0A6A5V9P4_9PLEO|nr:cytochrome P450 [Bimuria novae-zelandiae CBS 107.79]
MAEESTTKLLEYVQYAAFLVLIWFIALYSYRFTLHPLSKYPGPKLALVSDWYTVFYTLQKRLHLVTFRDHQRYGPVIRHGPNKLVFSSYKALHDIYQSERTNKVNSYLATQIRSDLYSVFNCLDKRLHKIKRRMISKALSEQKMRQFEPLMREHIDMFLKQLLRASRNNEPVDMSDRCKRLGVDIIGRFAFGYRLELQTSNSTQTITHTIYYLHTYHPPAYSNKNDFFVPGLIGASYMKNVRMQWLGVRWFVVELLFPSLYALRLKYFYLLKKMVKDRLAEGKTANEDLFSYVMDAKDPETGTKMRLGELVSEATFFFPAGGDTTATTISAVFFYLSRNPACYQKAISEIRRAFSSGVEIQSGPRLSGCLYLRAVIDEALRICPPTPGTLWRELPVGDQGREEPLVVDGHAIPAGTWVGVNAYTIHHNEEYFPDPFAFKPERWLDEGDTSEAIAARKNLREAFSPFSVGPRSCIGKAMAYMEASLTLALTMWYFDFSAPDDERLSKIGGGTPGDKKGRHRVNEFQTHDKFVSSHDGPYLMFKPRDDTQGDLE